MNMSHICLSLCASAIGLLGCGHTSKAVPEQNSQMGAHNSVAALDGDWQLVEATGLKVRAVHLRISGNRFSLNAGCNAMGGSVIADGNQGVDFRFAQTTLMGCPDDYDQIISEALAGTHRRVSMDMQYLELANSAGQLTFARLLPARQIEGSWKVHSLNNMRGGVVSSVHQPDQNLIFREGQISGFDGCSPVSGTYVLTRDRIEIDVSGPAREVCPFPNSDFDWAEAFHQALGGARRVEISPDQIRLRDADGALLIMLTK